MITIDQTIRQTPSARDGAHRRDEPRPGPTFGDALNEASEPDRREREDRTRFDSRDRSPERTTDPVRRPGGPHGRRTDGDDAPDHVDRDGAEVNAESSAPDGSTIALMAPVANTHLAIATTPSTPADTPVPSNAVATVDAGSVAIDPNGSTSADAEITALAGTTAVGDVEEASGTPLEPTGTGEGISPSRAEGAVTATTTMAPAATGSNAAAETESGSHVDPDVQIDPDGEARVDSDTANPPEVEPPVAEAARAGSGSDRSSGDTGGTSAGADGSLEPSIDSMESAAPDEPGPTAAPRSTSRDSVLGGSPAARELLERLDLRRASLDGSLEVEIRTERFGIVRVEAVDSGDGVSLSLRGDGSNGDELHDLARELRHEFERDGHTFADVDVDDRSADDRDASDLEGPGNDAGADGVADSEDVRTGLLSGGVDLHL